MAYGDDIEALSPDHRWRFNGNEAVDQVGAVNGTTTGTVAAAALCEDATNAIQTNAIAGDRISYATTTTLMFFAGDLNSQESRAMSLKKFRKSCKIFSKSAF